METNLLSNCRLSFVSYFFKDFFKVFTLFLLLYNIPKFILKFKNFKIMERETTSNFEYVYNSTTAETFEPSATNQKKEQEKQQNDKQIIVVQPAVNQGVNLLRGPSAVTW